MDVLVYIVAIIAAFIILVVAHELGHYVVARLSGVAVLEFSVGFGKRLVSFRDRRGTLFAISAIPLGGFVRMLDEREAEVPENLKPFAFNSAAPWRQICIALAGPFANLVLTFVIYWILLVGGSSMPIPILGHVDPSTPAYQAGLRGGEEIVSVDGVSTPSWFHINLRLTNWIGDTGAIYIGANANEGYRDFSITVDNWLEGESELNLLQGIGFQQDAKPIVDAVMPDSAAAQSGLKEGDTILRIDGLPINTWSAFVSAVSSSPGRSLQMVVDRDGRERLVVLHPERRLDNVGESYGWAGVSLRLQTHQVRLPPHMALNQSLKDTWAAVEMTVNIVRKMFLGDVSVESLAGPLTIAQIAGESARSGWRNFCHLLALLSVSLAVINLLPIPLLDGGHVLYGLVQMVTRHPVPAKVQHVGQIVGMVFVGALIVLVLFNDIVRLLG